MARFRSLTLLSAVALVSLLAGAGAWHNPDEGEGPIRLGMSTALTGPAKSLGQNMKLGVEAAILEANEGGGVHGRPIELLAYDDGYEPARTGPNMRTMIEKNNVLAVVGNVGTPTAVAAIPITNELKTLLYGAYTGAGVLRRVPPDRYVINYRASYAQETAAMVDALINHGGLAPQEIAFFTQRDAYGDAGYQGGLASLKRHGLADESEIAHGRYQRNTLAVENGLADIMQAKTPCRAVIMVGAYQPCAAFIELARSLGLQAVCLNVSFVGSTPLANALGEAGEGVVITQVVPSPAAQTPLAQGYRNALLRLSPQAEPSFGSFEGYIATRILLDAMRSWEGPIDRESVIDALEAMGDFELTTGLAMSLGPNDHQASDQVWPTVIEGGRVVPFDWARLGERLQRAQVETD